jgi:hypothetical protein
MAEKHGQQGKGGSPIFKTDGGESAKGSPRHGTSSRSAGGSGPSSADKPDKNAGDAGEIAAEQGTGREAAGRDHERERTQAKAAPVEGVSSDQSVPQHPPGGHGTSSEIVQGGRAR